MKRILASFLLLAALTTPALCDNAAGDGWRMIQPVRPNLQAHPLVSGTGATAGMSASHAVFVTANYTNSSNGTLERHFPLETWRGKRLRVELRLKDEADVRAWTNFYIRNADGSGLTPTRVEWNEMGTAAWQPHRFVVDVPANAEEFVLRVGLTRPGKGTGTVWVDTVSLEAPGADVPVNHTLRILTGQKVESSSVPAPSMAVGSAALAPDMTDWHLTRGMRPSNGIVIPKLTPVYLETGLMDGNRITYLGGAADLHTPDTDWEPQANYNWFGGLERVIHLQALRGKRVRLTLHFENSDGDARAYALAQVNRIDGPAIRTFAERSSPESGVWETRQFVLDVPDNASDLFVYAGFTGEGEVRLDGPMLETVGKDVPLSRAERIDISPDRRLDFSPLAPWTSPPQPPPPPPPPAPVPDKSSA